MDSSLGDTPQKGSEEGRSRGEEKFESEREEDGPASKGTDFQDEGVPRKARDLTRNMAEKKREEQRRKRKIKLKRMKSRGTRGTR